MQAFSYLTIVALLFLSFLHSVCAIPVSEGLVPVSGKQDVDVCNLVVERFKQQNVFSPLQKISSRHTGFHGKYSKRFVLKDTTPSLLPDSKSFRKDYKCRIGFDGQDPVTGKRKKELVYEPLFSYTAPHIKTYLPGKDLLEAEAKLIKIGGGYTYLSILFHWNAKNPGKAYGRLKNRAAIRCYLSQGKSVTLYNATESVWENKGNPTSHSMLTTFLIHPRQIKLLKKYPLQNLTIYWDRGYEGYPIYPVSLLMNQLSCLE